MCPWFKFNNLELTWPILHQWGKNVKIKSQKSLTATSHICRSYKGKKWTKNPLSWIGLINSFNHYGMALWSFSNGSLVTNKSQLKGNYKNKRYENYEKLLGIKFDAKLNFSEHLNDIMSKPAAKLMCCWE